MFSNGTSRIKKRRTALRQLDDINQSRETTILIHYSCESFFDNNASSNRTTSIGVRFLSSGQTRSFSIFQIAEELGYSSSDVPVNHDAIEKKLLENFFDFVKEHQHFRWIHWNMRDINYGFFSLEHRFKVLGGKPIVVPEEKKYDLSRILVDLYGSNYIGHPKLAKLIEKNDLTNKDFLTGAEEAEAFKSGQYAKLHRSTLRKCDNLESIFDKTCGDTLKVESKVFEKYGISPEIIGYLFRDHWIASIVMFFLAVFGFIVALKDIPSWLGLLK